MEYQTTVNGIQVNASYREATVREIFLPLLKKLGEMQKEKGRRILVLLAAPPGAGKSTLLSFLSHLSRENGELPSIQVIGMDGFHRRQEYLLNHFAERNGKQVTMVEIKGAPFDLKCSLFFKGSSYILQQLPDRQVLWADFFALTSADALGSLAVTAARGEAVVHSGIPAVEGLLGVHRGENIRDEDILRTVILIHTVAAAGAGDQVQAMEDVAHLAHRVHFRLVQRNKVPHGAQIILHLGHITHAGEHHGHVWEAGRKAQGVAGVTAAAQAAQNAVRVLRQVHQAAFPSARQRRWPGNTGVPSEPDLSDRRNWGRSGRSGRRGCHGCNRDLTAGYFHPPAPWWYAFC